jgi:hypothetical protein
MSSSDVLSAGVGQLCTYVFEGILGDSSLAFHLIRVPMDSTYIRKKESF